ncbi:hypothetical protein C4564_01210 [Candidatus Microgenomates bacterium]|nr:MAG: hypothetical protein C4564_01210 [Candidatus Microgenomates bacterium]
MTDYANKRNNRIKTSTSAGLSRRNVILSLVFAAPIMVLVLVAVLSSSKGVELANIEQQIVAARTASRELEDAIIKESSLTQLAEPAAQLGLVEPRYVVYVDKKSSVARLP